MRPLFAALDTSLLCCALAFAAVVAAPLASTPLAAQATATRAKGKAATKADATPAITGNYVGTATVPLGDSTLVVPVSYLFTGTAAAMGGTAMVPGQGSGAISNVVRTGTKFRFRVTAPENRLLEHDGVIAANGTIEGFVNLDNKPVAKFKIAPKR